MKIETIKLNLKNRGYSILVTEEASQSLIHFLKAREKKIKRPSKIYLLSDERLVEARAALVEALRAKKFEVHEIAVTAGEGLKDIEVVYPIYGRLLALKADRDSILLALGGGSVGDVAGFIAATYMRGIDWIGLPTTLLSQVDSSVGGKTGINHKAGKNLIGAFHQPVLVVCASQYLKTLGPREIVSGIGEIVKILITFDPKTYASLEKNLSKVLANDSSALRALICKAISWKCKMVKKDELDRTGAREILNFGHTFGHALESATHYEVYQHGEAVIWGMQFALGLSVARKKLNANAHQKIAAFLNQLPVPPIPPELTRAQIFSFIKKDKKAQGNTIRFVLLERLGRTVSDRGVTNEHLNQAFDLMIKGRAYR